jgi:hypothetical protein
MIYFKPSIKLITSSKGIDKASEEEKRNFVGGKNVTPTEDILAVFCHFFSLGYLKLEVCRIIIYHMNLIFSFVS